MAVLHSLSAYFSRLGSLRLGLTEHIKKRGAKYESESAEPKTLKL